MKYIDKLKMVKDANVNIIKLFIAHEVDSLLKEQISVITEESFEEICTLVYENYLKIDYSCVEDVARIVCSLYVRSQKIDQEIIRDKLENACL